MDGLVAATPTPQGKGAQHSLWDPVGRAGVWAQLS